MVGTFAGAYLDVGPVDEVLVLAPDDHLPRDDHLVVLLVAQWGPGEQRWSASGQNCICTTTKNKRQPAKRKPGSSQSDSHFLVPVVEGDGDRGLGHPGLPVLVHQGLQSRGLSQISQKGSSQHPQVCSSK